MLIRLFGLETCKPLACSQPGFWLNLSAIPPSLSLSRPTTNTQEALIIYTDVKNIGYLRENISSGAQAGHKAHALFGRARHEPLLKHRRLTFKRDSWLDARHRQHCIQKLSPEGETMLLSLRCKINIKRPQTANPAPKFSPKSNCATNLPSTPTPPPHDLPATHSNGLQLCNPQLPV